MSFSLSLFGYLAVNILIYLPFHLFEEAIGDFPKWMYEHKWLPFHMKHGHWMANNLFIYYPLLIAALVLYLLKDSLVCFGVGILVWGLINFGDHFFYTIKDRKISPGLLTGILFLINSVLGLKAYLLSDLYSVPQLGFGILIGAFLFAVPIGLCIVVYPFFEKYIK